MSTQPDPDKKNQADPVEANLPQENIEEETQANNGSDMQTTQTELKGAVNLWGTIGITLYVIFVTLLFGYALLAFWPADISNAGQTTQGDNTVHFFGATLRVFNEVRMLVLIALIGAMGGQVRILRSLYWYIGNRKLVWSWIVMYILLPFVGAILGLVFYFVIRAGFFSPTATIDNANPIGFIALAALAGMFSEQAVLKLKDVAETLLKEPPSGSDSKPQAPQP